MRQVEEADMQVEKGRKGKECDEGKGAARRSVESMKRRKSEWSRFAALFFVPLPLLSHSAFCASVPACSVELREREKVNKRVMIT